MSVMLDQARIYRERRLNVMPVWLNKTPRLKSWRELQGRASTEKEIEGWFAKGEANLAIVTGAVSGVWVLDADNDEVVARVEAMIAAGEMPGTPYRVRTRRGRHYYYSIPDGRRVKSGPLTRLMAHLDVKGDGGYVVAPPSVYSDRSGVYAWIDGFDPALAPPEFHPESIRTAAGPD
jgi:hypothetical protein